MQTDEKPNTKWRIYGIYLGLVPLLASLPDVALNLTWLLIGLLVALVSFLGSRAYKLSRISAAWPVLVYLLIAGLTLSQSSNLTTSINHFVVRLSFIFVIAFTVSYVQTYEQMDMIYRWWLGASIFAACVGIAEIILGSNPLVKMGILGSPDADYASDVSRTGYARSVGIYSQPILFAYQLVVVIPYVLMRTDQSKRFSKVALTFLLLLGVVASGTRGALVVTLLILILGLAQGKSPEVRKRAAYMVAILATFYFSSQFAAYFSTTIQDFISGNVDSEASQNLALRYNMILAGLEAIRDRLWFGLGIGTPHQARETLLLGLGNFGSFENTILFVFMESGLIGLVPFVFMVGYYLVKAQKLPDVEFKGVRINKSVHMSMIGCLLLGLNVSIVNFGHAFYVYAILIGLTISGERIGKGASLQL